MDKLREIAALWNNISETIPYLSQLIGVLLVVFAATLAMRLIHYGLTKTFAAQTQKMPHKEAKLKTLESIAKSVLRYTIYFVAALSILGIFEAPTASLVASAGIFGLAVGFGAQNLVRDVITGFFILFEDQYSIGDYIVVSGVDGIVDSIGLRITRLKDFSGVIHTIPNGKIDMVSNHSRSIRRALVNVSVAYEENISHVISVLEELCLEMAETIEGIVEGPTVLGVADLGDSEVVIRILARTQNMMQWGIEREIRKQIKLRFDDLGIEIPYPRRVVYARKEEGAPDVKGT